MRCVQVSIPCGLLFVDSVGPRSVAEMISSDKDMTLRCALRNDNAIADVVLFVPYGICMIDVPINSS
jgi:hypothetical protein